MARNQTWKKRADGSMELIEDIYVPDVEAEPSLEEKVKALEEKVDKLEKDKETV